MVQAAHHPRGLQHEEEGAFWDVLFRWSPEPVREGMGLSMAEALTALVSKYLDCVVAAEQTEIEEFFGNFVGRSRVKDAVKALLSARELSFVHVGNRSLVQVAPPRVPFSQVTKDQKPSARSACISAPHLNQKDRAPCAAFDTRCLVAEADLRPVA